MKNVRLLPENRTALVVIITGFAFLILFWWYPLIRTFILGFQLSGVGRLKESWIGLAHYRALFSSKVFGNRRVTLLFRRIHRHLFSRPVLLNRQRHTFIFCRITNNSQNFLWSSRNRWGKRLAEVQSNYLTITHSNYTFCCSYKYN